MKKIYGLEPVRMTKYKKVRDSSTNKSDNTPGECGGCESPKILGISKSQHHNFNQENPKKQIQQSNTQQCFN